MKYNDHLTTTKDCPFCHLVSNKIIKKGEKSYLTYALAPYCKHHLLVIPDRHVENYEDLSIEEKNDIDDLLTAGIKSLKILGHKGYSILLRNGEGIGKTIKHLHYHIIPSVEVGSLTVNDIGRKIMTEDEIGKLLEEFSGLD
jgi:diadenosine tetraphosphate (Ap4A) HIT family hydrolase